MRPPACSLLPDFEQMRVDSMQHGESFGGNTIQERFMLAIEIVERLACQRGADGTTGSNSTAPRLSRERHRFIEDKHGMKVKVTGGPGGNQRHVAGVIRMRPGRIVVQHELLRCSCDRVLA